MIAVVQRVTRAGVVSKKAEATIGHGLCVLLGVEVDDTLAHAEWMAGKIARLRIFPDDDDRMNRSVKDVGGSILLVSQFTLVGDCRTGNRPSFARAASPDKGETLYEQVVGDLRNGHRLTVKTGVFGARMQVDILNDGPVTLVLRHPRGE